MQFSETPDTIIEHPASVQCSGCGEDISEIESLSYQRRQVYDLPPIKMSRLRRDEHRSEVKCCPNCGVENKGDFPIDVPHSLQYGNNLKAWAVYLVH